MDISGHLMNVNRYHYMTDYIGIYVCDRLHMTNMKDIILLLDIILSINIDIRALFFKLLNAFCRLKICYGKIIIISKLRKLLVIQCICYYVKNDYLPRN